MPLQATSGAASYDAFGGGVAVAAKYIEDFFQTWLRTGTGLSTTVTTGLNASINKSLVLTKSRSAATNHKLTDTARGVTKALSSNTTGAEVTDSQGLTAFSSTGYTIGTNTDYNNNGATYVDWQWVATPKFFDIVTYTGDGTNRTIAHNLGSVPGCIIVKRTDTTSNWQVYHNGLSSAANSIQLNLTNAQAAAPTIWNSTAPTSTVFSVGNDARVNATGGTYVAYLFAHNAGGFGLTGTDNVISCGSFTTDGSGNATVNLGYEPQWVMVKASSTTSNWEMYDSMRGLTATSASARLYPNLSSAEGSTSSTVNITSTGFMAGGNMGAGAGGVTYIYIAIRRGPMRTPTTGTSVFSPVTQLGASFVNAGFPVDFNINTFRNISSGKAAISRLTNGNVLETNSTAAEGTVSYFNFANQNGIQDNYNSASQSTVYWNFRRAPGFFDVVCYTGTGANGQVSNHNLSVIPEMVIIKGRDSTFDWFVYTPAVPSGRHMELNRTSAAINDGGPAFSLSSTTITFNRTYVDTLNTSGQTYVAYLFASCPGVSKVGSYTGTGTTQVINCGFAAGSRFVLIKRTDSTGDWYVWDSARGIVAGNDPYLLLNSTAAEVTNTDFVDTAATGFEISSTAPAAINASGGTFIFLAIA